MKSDDKGTVKIILGVVGCLGCAGLGFLLAVFGFGFWASSAVAPMPYTPPALPLPPIPPTIAPATNTSGFVPPPVPRGWSPYVQSAPCPGESNLRLAQFRAAYPATFAMLPCQEQEPRPWAYVTFHLEDEAGSADKQITFGFSRGVPTQQMLEDAAAQLVGQLGAPAPRLLDTASFLARGGSLTRRDAVFTVPATTGVFVPGSYLIRQVVVPGPGLAAEGMMVTLMHRVRTTEPAAILESNNVLLHAVNSIQF